MHRAVGTRFLFQDVLGGLEGWDWNNALHFLVLLWSVAAIGCQLWWVSWGGYSWALLVISLDFRVLSGVEESQVEAVVYQSRFSKNISSPLSYSVHLQSPISYPLCLRSPLSNSCNWTYPLEVQVSLHCSPLFHWGKVCQSSRTGWCGTTGPASQPALGFLSFCLLRLELQVSCHVLLFNWVLGSKLLSFSCLHGKHFSHKPSL